MTVAATPLPLGISAETFALPEMCQPVPHRPMQYHCDMCHPPPPPPVIPEWGVGAGFCPQDVDVTVTQLQLALPAECCCTREPNVLCLTVPCGDCLLWLRL